MSIKHQETNKLHLWYRKSSMRKSDGCPTHPVVVMNFHFCDRCTITGEETNYNAENYICRSDGCLTVLRIHWRVLNFHFHLHFNVDC